MELSEIAKPGQLKMHYSWTQVDAAIKCIHAQLSHPTLRPFDTVIAIARGGIIPAALLQQRMCIPRFKVLSATSYSQQRQENVTFDHDELAMLIQKDEARNLLVVDDIWDTGNTIHILRSYLPRATYAVLTVKRHMRRDWPDIISGTRLECLNSNPWIVFPWESEHSW